MKPRKAGRPKKPSGPHDPSNRTRIQEVALRLFAEKGFDGTTVQEIVSEARTNLSMISYYFGGKEGLYKSCLDQVGQKAIESTDRLLSPPKTREEFLLRLRLFVEEVMDFHIKNRDVTAIIARESAQPGPVMRSLIENCFYRSYHVFQSFLEAAQKAKILHADLDVPTFSIFFFNSLIGICRSDACAVTILGKKIEDKDFREAVVSLLMDRLIMSALKDETAG
ncbi:MAG: TetR family transcriptional regulator [Oligoflexia bacterium]|nr:TetR family transcriptional regulator [Oligoflexia bacterium]